MGESESMPQSSVYWMDGTAEQATTALCAGDINNGEFACTGGLTLREVPNIRRSRHATLLFFLSFYPSECSFMGVFFPGRMGSGSPLLSEGVNHIFSRTGENLILEGSREGKIPLDLFLDLYMRSKWKCGRRKHWVTSGKVSQPMLFSAAWLISGPQSN